MSQPEAKAQNRLTTTVRSQNDIVVRPAVLLPALRTSYALLADIDCFQLQPLEVETYVNRLSSFRALNEYL